jgi:hypothetical protein
MAEQYGVYVAKVFFPDLVKADELGFGEQRNRKPA